MTWAKIDDHANEHPKLLKAGAKASWLWACALMYANRQRPKTGRIPKEMVTVLYPGVGKREAKRLVDVGLWLDEGDHYQIHEYYGWNPEIADLSEKRAEAGRKGGKASGKARKSKQTTKQLASETGSKPRHVASNDEANFASEIEAAGSTTTTTPLDPPLPPLRDPLADSLNPAEQDPEVCAVFADYCDACDITNARLDTHDKRAAAIRDRMRQGWTRDRLRKVFQGAKLDPWLAGEVGLKLAVILGDAERMEACERAVDNPPGQRPRPTRKVMSPSERKAQGAPDR